MNKKLSLFITILVLVAVLALVLLTSLPLRKTAGLPEKENPFMGTADLLTQLKAAQAGEGKLTEETLRVLAERNDAIGYAANVVLADKESAPIKERIMYLRQALELYENKNLRFKLAALLATLGEVEAAITEYLPLLPDNEALNALVGLNADVSLILDKLITTRQWQTASDVIEAIPGKKESLNNQNKLHYGQILVELGQYEKALPVLAELAEVMPEQQVVQFHYARALEATKETKKAILAYSRAGAHGAYNLGILYEKLGRSEDAAAAYVLSTEAVALWRGAVLWDELGNNQRALETYLSLVYKKNLYQDDAAYRALMMLRDTSEMEKETETVLSLLTAPAWMKRLDKEPFWTIASEPEEVMPPILERLDAYKNVERNDLLEVELAIAWFIGSPEEKILIAEWHLQKNDLQQAVRWSAAALKEIPTKRAYLLAYPRPFAEEVMQAASEFSLEPELIWAVMREESRYNATAISWVGARGLMQIMPATGKEIAGSLRTDYHEDDLFDPLTNTRFGAFYLRKLLDMFDGDYDKALAAYNGGMGNVKRWSESNLGKTDNGFPTAITFLETREYITKVSNAYLTYKWLSYNNK